MCRFSRYGQNGMRDAYACSHMSFPPNLSGICIKKQYRVKYYGEPSLNVIIESMCYERFFTYYIHLPKQNMKKDLSFQK